MSGAVGPDQGTTYFGDGNWGITYNPGDGNNGMSAYSGEDAHLQTLLFLPLFSGQISPCCLPLFLGPFMTDVFLGVGTMKATKEREFAVVEESDHKDLLAFYDVTLTHTIISMPLRQ